jgi:hypothetical protein
MRSEAALAEVRALALERFPRERATLETFFSELGRLRDPREFEQLLSRLEELLEALLAGEAHGLERR